jgi:hypothetical protein
LLLVETVSSSLRERRYSPILDASSSFPQNMYMNVNPNSSISSEEDSQYVSPALCGAVFDAFGRLFCFTAFSSIYSKRVPLPKSYFDYKIFSLKIQVLEQSDEKPSFVDQRSKRDLDQRSLFSFPKSNLIQQDLTSADSVKAVIQTSIVAFNFADLCGVDVELSQLYMYNFCTMFY